MHKLGLRVDLVFLRKKYLFYMISVNYWNASVLDPDEFKNPVAWLQVTNLMPIVPKSYTIYTMQQFYFFKKLLAFW
jgi:hypothetical protein